MRDEERCARGGGEDIVAAAFFVEPLAIGWDFYPRKDEKFRLGVAQLDS